MFLIDPLSFTTFHGKEKTVKNYIKQNENYEENEYSRISNYITMKEDEKMRKWEFCKNSLRLRVN